MVLRGIVRCWGLVAHGLKMDAVVVFLQEGYGTRQAGKVEQEEEAWAQVMVCATECSATRCGEALQGTGVSRRACLK